MDRRNGWMEVSGLLALLLRLPSLRLLRTTDLNGSSITFVRTQD